MILFTRSWGCPDGGGRGELLREEGRTATGDSLGGEGVVTVLGGAAGLSLLAVGKTPLPTPLVSSELFAWTEEGDPHSLKGWDNRARTSSSTTTSTLAVICSQRAARARHPASIRL
mmetsp:Transcript_54103/g.99312  ORF Transcript_54103/g.99312 Transcript_54103/m.99312 type:complete len:116 (+) Transcript_54103:506-853(+)